MSLKQILSIKRVDFIKELKYKLLIINILNIINIYFIK